MDKKKFAFTLAEVLITLAVIGVVAAITVPAVSQHTNNEQYRVASYKNASVLNNAIRLAYAFDSIRINEFKDSNDLKLNFKSNLRRFQMTAKHLKRYYMNPRDYCMKCSKPFHEDGREASMVRGSLRTGWVKVMRRA